MKITIFGTGYVGLVTGTCLADVGHDVMCMDVDADKIAGLEAGRIPIYEPGLEEMVKANVASGRLRFTTDAEQAVGFGMLQFIAVGTPPDEDGSADLRYVLEVANTIGRYMNDEKIVVDKSTVPVGTADKVHETIAAALEARGVGAGGGVRCAAGEEHRTVEALGLHDNLDRVGDDVPAHEREVHALVAHRDAVGDGDGAEL